MSQKSRFLVNDLHNSALGLNYEMSSTKPPLGGVISFAIPGNGVNKGSIPVYSYEIMPTIIDTKNNSQIYDQQNT